MEILIKLVILLVYCGEVCMLQSFCYSGLDITTNQCPPQTEAKRLLINYSFKDCMKQCSVRGDCQVMCYWNGFKLCEIHDTIVSLVPCQRCLSVQRDEILTKQFNSPCGPCQEEAGQFCNIKTEQCEYECGKISSPHRRIKGNLAYVGAKIVVKCINDAVCEETIVGCNHVGQWTPLPTCDLQDIQCLVVDDIYALSEDLSIRISSTLSTQSDAVSKCDSLGGSLIKLDEEIKINNLRNILQNCEAFSSSDYWVDGRLQGDNLVDGRLQGDNWVDGQLQGGNFIFSDGESMPMEQGIFWAPGTPNNDDSVESLCTRMDQSQQFLLNDKECFQLYRFVCEFQITS